MNELEDFLRVRLDEDEATALGTQRCEDGRCEYGLTWSVEDGYVDELSIGIEHTSAPGFINPGQAAHVVRYDPARALREVAAKRAILEWLQEARKDVADYGIEHSIGFGAGYFSAMKDVVVRLARVYSEHPDWREDGEPCSARPPMAT